MIDDEDASDASNTPEDTKVGAAGRRKFDDEEDEDDVRSPPLSPLCFQT